APDVVILAHNTKEARLIDNWNERLAEAIERLRRQVIEERSDTATARYNRETALATGGLPIWSSFGGCLAIRPNGMVVCYTDNEEVDERVDFKWQRLALVVAGEKYAELQELVPVRPNTAAACHLCNGVGKCSGTILRWCVLLSLEPTSSVTN